MSPTALNRVADAMGLVATLVVSLGVGTLLVVAASAEPGVALRAFFAGPFTNAFFFGNMLQAAAPLIITGLGAVLAFRAGAVNLGVEGQVYAGGLAGGAALLLAGVHSGWFLPVAVLVGALAGGALAALAGWLRVRFGASEAITSFLIGAAVIQLFDLALRRYLVDPAAAFPATRAIEPALRLARLAPPSNLNLGFFVGVALAALVFLLLFRTRFGYGLRLTGSNPRFARYSGLRTRRLVVWAMLLSGAFAGAAAVLEVAGVHGRLITGFSNDLGWNGITVALIARLHPLGVIPAALLYGYLQVGASSASLLSDVSPRVATVVQSVIFYLITAQALYVWFRRRLVARGAVPGERSIAQRPGTGSGA